MRGPAIIARTLSVPSVVSRTDGRVWQYHPRSDQHSKVACWAILLDLLETSSLLKRHVADGKVAFGINRQINDWSTGRRKNLDLVVARAGASGDQLRAFDLVQLADKYKIVLTDSEKTALSRLPGGSEGAAGSTVLASIHRCSGLVRCWRSGRS